MSSAIIGAKMNATKPKITNTIPSGLSLLSSPPDMPVQNVNRRKRSDISATMPTMVTARVDNQDVVVADVAELVCEHAFESTPVHLVEQPAW